MSFAALCMLLSTPICAQNPLHSITVSGNGSANVEPDRFAISVTLEEKGGSVTKLQSSMQHRLQQIISFLVDEGIEKSNIQSMNVNLYPWYENSNQGRQQSGVVLSRQIHIQGQLINDYDVILDGLLSRGVNRIDSFQFIHSDELSARDQAIVLAIADAKAKATLMANQLGQKITGVLSVSQQDFVPMRSRAPMMMRSEAVDTSLPGTIDFTSSVQVTFAFEQQDN
jgi:uncharacterized protein YggE